MALGKIDDAVESYRTALAHRPDSWPDFSEVHNNLGIDWRALGKVDEALISYRARDCRQA